MTVSQRQFKLLTEMDISLWQRRVLKNNELTAQELPSKEQHSNTHSQTATIAAKTNNDKNTANEKTLSKASGEQQIEALNIELLNKQQIFTDILLSLNLKADDIQLNQNTLKNNQLVWQVLTWQFSSTEKITLTKNILTTPTIADLAKSTTLKAQLWQAIQDK